MKTFTSTNSLIVLAVAVFALFAYSFSSATWIPAPANPPEGNVAAPINVSDTDQTKDGSIISRRAVTANQLIANDRVRSNLYCDINGENCFTATSSPLAGGGGGSMILGNTFESDWHGRGQTTIMCPTNSVMVGTEANWSSSRGIAGLRPICAWILSAFNQVAAGQWQMQWGSCDVTGWTVVCSPSGDDDNCDNVPVYSQTSSYICVNQDDNTERVPDSFCTAPKPAETTQSCTP